MRGKGCLGCLVGVVVLVVSACTGARKGVSFSPSEGLFRDVEASARAAAEGGRYEAAVQRYAEARRAAIRAGNLREAARCALLAGQWSMAAGKGDEAERWWGLAEQEGRMFGAGEITVRAYLLRGRWRLERGETAAAEEAGKAALSFLVAGMEPGLVRDVRLLRAEVAVKVGAIDRAREEMEAIPRQARPPAGSPAEAMVHQVWAGILAAEGMPGEAAARVERAAAIWERVGRSDAALGAWEWATVLWKRDHRSDKGIAALLRAALLREALGERDRAIQMAREAAEWAEQGGDTGGGAWARQLERFWMAQQNP